MKRIVIAAALSLVFAIGFVAACQQGEGERCQVNDDCKDPLVCVSATQTCAEPGANTGLDANVPIDAPDAAFFDAPPDAPDAMSM